MVSISRHIHTIRIHGVQREMAPVHVHALVIVIAIKHANPLSTRCILDRRSYRYRTCIEYPTTTPPSGRVHVGRVVDGEIGSSKE